MWRESIFRLAFDGDVVVGYLLVFPFERETKSIVNIVRLMIDARYQGKGLGGDLLRAAIVWVSGFQPRPRTIRISTMADNTVALSLYRSLGFHEAGIEDGEIALCCRKTSMEIVVLRQGKPKIADSREVVSAFEFGHWVDAYSIAGIDNSHPPPVDSVSKANTCKYVVCSDLPRAIESVAALLVRCAVEQDPLFRECEMPYTKWRVLKLPVAAWSIAFRFLHILGFSREVESFKEARERAGCCVARLNILAQEHESVLLVGHGALNWLISRKLIQGGWVAQRRASGGYWSYVVFHRGAT